MHSMADAAPAPTALPMGSAIGSIVEMWKPRKPVDENCESYLMPLALFPQDIREQW